MARVPPPGSADRGAMRPPCVMRRSSGTAAVPARCRGPAGLVVNSGSKARSQHAVAHAAAVVRHAQFDAAVGAAAWPVRCARCAAAAPAVASAALITRLISSSTSRSAIRPSRPAAAGRASVTTLHVLQPRLVAQQRERSASTISLRLASCHCDAGAAASSEISRVMAISRAVSCRIGPRGRSQASAGGAGSPLRCAFQHGARVAVDGGDRVADLAHHAGRHGADGGQLLLVHDVAALDLEVALALGPARRPGRRPPAPARPVRRCAPAAGPGCGRPPRWPAHARARRRCRRPGARRTASPARRCEVMPSQASEAMVTVLPSM